MDLRGRIRRGGNCCLAAGPLGSGYSFGHREWRCKTVTKFDASYWEGVAIAMIMEKAFQRAHDKFGRINSETINQALETFRDEDFGGVVPNITYTKTDHSASFKARIVQIHEDATYTPLTTFYVPGKERVKLLKRR